MLLFVFFTFKISFIKKIYKQNRPLNLNTNTTFVPVIMLRLKSNVLFGMHTLLDKSFRVLQLPRHLSNLTGNDISEIPDGID